MIMDKRWVLACVCALAVGCGDDADDDAHKDAGSDAGGQGGSGGSGGGPGRFDAGPLDGGMVSECLAVAPVACDGPEDCPAGQMCCGSYTGAAYGTFMCADSCADLALTGEIWSELCHAGQTCETDGYACNVNEAYLPTFLARCRDTGEPAGAQASTAAGEVNCGEGFCGAGEHCCLRTPKEPYCVADDVECSCDGPGEPEPEPDAGSDNDAG